jgi:hypothetical protein
MLVVNTKTKSSETNSLGPLWPKIDIRLLKFWVVTFLLFTSFCFAQTNIVRASFSTAPQTQKIGGFTVQQSMGHMGPVRTSQQSSNTVISGFLIPQDVIKDSQLTAPQSTLEWSLYPIPFTTHINIDFSSPVYGDMQLMLFDPTGKLMMEKTLEAKQKQRISMEHLAEGTYMISISVLEKSFSSQILKY